MHGNHLGVPIVTTDSAGNLAAPAGYTPVGFPGQTRTLADLFYNQYRDYDPTTGRYIQADPIGLGGGSNPYSYALGNPLKNTDPHGKSVWRVIFFAGASALADVGIQLTLGHRSFECIDWWQVGFSAFLGGATAGASEWLVAARTARSALRAERAAAEAAAYAEAAAAEAAAEAKLAGAAADFPPGSFSVSDWSSYPAGVPRAQGPFRIIEGTEYREALAAKKAANRIYRSENGIVGPEWEVHEIQPIKFGGSPTDPTNKIVLSRDVHRQQVTPWWNQLQGDLGH